MLPFAKHFSLVDCGHVVQELEQILAFGYFDKWVLILILDFSFPPFVWELWKYLVCYLWWLKFVALVFAGSSRGSVWDGFVVNFWSGWLWSLQREMEPPQGFLASLWSLICFLPFFVGLLLLGTIKGWCIDLILNLGLFCFFFFLLLIVPFYSIRPRLLINKLNVIRTLLNLSCSYSKYEC